MDRCDEYARAPMHNQARRFIHQSHPRRLVTYSKKDSKPIQLTGRQFRPSVYDIPPDDSDIKQNSQCILPSFTEGRDFLQTSDRLESRPLEEERSKTRTQYHEGTAEPITADRVVSKPINDTGWAFRTHTARAVEQLPKVQSAKSTKRAKCYIENAPKAVSKRKALLSRGLPTHELHLVPSESEYYHDHAAVCNRADLAISDPIQDSSFPPCNRALLPVENRNRASPKNLARTRIGVLKNRWKGPPPMFKPIMRESKLQSRSMKPHSQDGFEDTEIQLRPTQKRRARTVVRSSSLPDVTALELMSGPQPDVQSDDLATKLSMVVKTDTGDPITSGYSTHDDALFMDPGIAPRQSQRRASSIQRARERMIKAELSTIRAPERIPSDSEDCDDESSGEGELESDGELGSIDPSPTQDSQPTMPFQREDNSDQGVTLDFRREMQPGRTGRTSSTTKLRRPILIEVDETIIKMCEPEVRRAQDTTDGQLDAKQAGHVKQCSASGESIVNVQNGCILITNTDVPTSHQPRSILKNSTLFVPDLTAAPESTAANTRRNSTIGTSRSCYFAEAADTLRSPDPARHVIVPRRRSSYFDEQIGVLDTDGWAPKTSPNPVNYVDEGELSVMRKSSEAVFLACRKQRRL